MKHIVHIDDEQEWLDTVKMVLKDIRPNITVESHQTIASFVASLNKGTNHWDLVITDGYLTETLTAKEICYYLEDANYSGPVMTLSGDNIWKRELAEFKNSFSKMSFLDKSEAAQKLAPFVEKLLKI